MNEVIYFVIVVAVSVTVISYLAKKILDRPLKDIIGDWISVFFS